MWHHLSDLGDCSPPRMASQVPSLRDQRQGSSLAGPALWINPQRTSIRHDRGVCILLHSYKEPTGAEYASTHAHILQDQMKGLCGQNDKWKPLLEHHCMLKYASTASYTERRALMSLVVAEPVCIPTDATAGRWIKYFLIHQNLASRLRLTSMKWVWRCCIAGAAILLVCYTRS